ncbi:MAG: hypothetical protein WCA91_09420 [Candidatus Acidiferrales bacterium]
MNRIATRSIIPAFLAITSALASSCTVPLAPGYRILKESSEVRFTPGPPPELQVNVSYTLRNSGTSSLSFVDVIFPDEKLYGRKSLRIKVDGHDITPGKLPEELQQESPEALRIPLDPVWERKQGRSLTIEYAFSSPSDEGMRITLASDNFHLSSRGWLPLPQPPKRILAPYPVRPQKTTYSVRVPVNFLVLARGTPLGRKKDGGEIEYRFQLRKAELPPFMVAGRYVDSAANRGSTSVSFWTFEPLKQDPAIAAQRIAAAWSTLQKDFGPLDKNITSPHVIECPELRADVQNSDDHGENAVASFPGGVLVRTLADGLGSDELLLQMNEALAHSWFREQIYPAANAAIGLGQGLSNYATIVMAEASGGESARRNRVIEFLRAYQDAVKQAAGTPNAEKAIISTMPYDPIDQRRMARSKAALFFIALEDAYGEEPVRRGLTDVVALLRGEQVGYEDVRSALEHSTGKDLGEPFRVWLYTVGIPKDFSDRYAFAATNGGQ